MAQTNPHSKLFYVEKPPTQLWVNSLYWHDVVQIDARHSHFRLGLLQSNPAYPLRTLLYKCELPD